jgi:hypothetical protein
MSTVHSPRTARGLLRSTADVAGPLHIAVLDATTQETLYTTLDERLEVPVAVRYRELFDEAVGVYPDRGIVVVRVPVDDWYDETTVRMLLEDRAAA